jgi:hypothetical protein
MPITAQAIITKVQAVLQDSGTRWPTAELIGWINEAQLEIATLRPDAASERVTLQLAAGARQTLSATWTMLLDVIRNMGTSGTAAGAPIRQTNRRILDAVEPGWHTRTAATVIQHFMYDPRNPREFLVYPPSTGTTYVELLVGTVPTAVAVAGDTLDMRDEYENPLVDFVLYRCFSKDIDFAGNAERAVLHRRAFDNSLGLKAQADASNKATA